MRLQWPIRVRDVDSAKPPPLKPAGHNAAAEALVQPIIFLGSSILATVACYVLAQDQLTAIFTGHGTAQDWLVVVLVGGLGIMVDTAMVLSASRLRMHLTRGKRDWPWAVVTGLMLLLCLGVEGMTLLYFGYVVSPSSIPSNVVQLIKGIHEILFFIRNGMPPLIIAFFTTALLPLTIEPADRDRATKASTSVNIAALQEDLVQVGELVSRADKIQALADQMALFEHASHATEEEKQRNKDLIAQLRSQGGDLPPTDDTVWVTKDHLAEMLAQQAEQARAMLEETVQALEGKLLVMLEEVKRLGVGNGPPQAKWSRGKADAIQRGILGEESGEEVLNGEGVS